GYYLGAVELDRVLGHSMQEQNFICQLSEQQMLGAYLLTVLVAFIAAIIGGFRAIKVEPAEIFRQQ
ncbi:MAG: ABC transporter permease, partial [Betaproteobacteria bacterium]|nr:ABC transporter permease [Betaproteobacteria bacterium]